MVSYHELFNYSNIIIRVFVKYKMFLFFNSCQSSGQVLSVIWHHPCDIRECRTGYRADESVCYKSDVKMILLLSFRTDGRAISWSQNARLKLIYRSHWSFSWSYLRLKEHLDQTLRVVRYPMPGRHKIIFGLASWFWEFFSALF